MPSSALVAIALAALAFGGERLAYYGARTLIYPVSVEADIPSTWLYRLTALAGIVGVLVGGGLAYALGSRLTGLLGALLALLGAGVCVVSPGLVGLALLAFGCGVFRPAPFGVVLEEVPSAPSPGRFRRVAAALAVIYLGVDAAGFLSSFVGTIGNRFGLAPAFALVCGALVAVSVLFVVLLVMGPRRHLQAETRLELVRAPDGAPYRGGAFGQASGPELPLGLLGAVLMAYALESLSQGVAFFPQGAGGGFGFSATLVRGGETFAGFVVTLAIGLLFALGEVRVRSVRLFAAGLGVYALAALLRVPVAGFFPIVFLLGLVIVAGQSLAVVAGLAAFASRFPKRVAPLAVAVWYFVSMGIPFMMGLVPPHGYASVAAGLAAFVALGGAALLFAFGEQLQPELDP